MRIIISKHVTVDKIPILAKHGFKISLKHIINTVTDPDMVDTETDKPKIIASRSIDKKHILRVVY